MRVPGKTVKTVAFIAEHSGSEDAYAYDLHGTGFFVSLPSRVNSRYRYHYFITAKHIAESLMGRPISFLVNSNDGGLTFLEPLCSVDKKTGKTLFRWYMHPEDKCVDVAVVPFDPPEGKAGDPDIVSIPSESFIKREDIDGERIALGDEVFMPGLFHLAQESGKRNVPIIRQGTLAVVPDDPIYLEVGCDKGFCEAYLIEARSIGGLSGSPVIVRRTKSILCDAEGNAEKVHGVGELTYFMGLTHGHWDVKESQINSPLIIHDSQRGVNLGIAIVVPAHKVMEVINHPELVAMRERTEERLSQMVAPTADGGVARANKPLRKTEGV